MATCLVGDCDHLTRKPVNGSFIDCFGVCIGIYWGYLKISDVDVGTAGVFLTLFL